MLSPCVFIIFHSLIRKVFRNKRSNDAYMYFFILPMVIECIYCGANVFPEFLRAIKGETFLWYYVIYGFSILTIVYHIEKKHFIKQCKQSFLSFKDYSFSEIDYFAIRSFSKYRIAGYCLLKELLYKHVAYRDKQIIVNSECLPKDMDDYSRQCIKWLAQRQANNGDMSFTSILCDMPNTIYRTGSSAVYKASNTKCQFRTFSICLFTVFGIAPGLIKLFMGITRGKNIGYLVALLALMAFLYARWLYSESKYPNELLPYIKPYLPFNESDNRVLLDDLQAISEKTFTEQEKIDLLQSYFFVHFESESKRLDPELFSSSGLLVAIDMLEADELYQIEQEKAMNARSDSGCSSCSSCSSCGGGGCGGCGD